MVASRSGNNPDVYTIIKITNHPWIQQEYFVASVFWYQESSHQGDCFLKGCVIETTYFISVLYLLLYPLHKNSTGYRVDSRNCQKCLWPCFNDKGTGLENWRSETSVTAFIDLLQFWICSKLAFCHLSIVNFEK